MKNRIVYIIIPLMLVLWTGCKEEGRIDYFDSNAPAPAQVTMKSARGTPGGAVLKYELPTDKNLLYVQAVYEIQPGVVCETKSSYFKDSLVLEGFGDTRTYDVKLYSVGKNEKASEPLTVQITPLTAPIHLSTKSIRETFGGITIDIVNPLRENLAIVLMADTANVGYLSIIHTFYTSMAKGAFSYRNMKTKPYDFAVYFRDRWYNYSDTTVARLTPWFEEFIPKGTWKENSLPGDVAAYSTTYRLSNLWDEDYGPSSGNFHSTETTPLPNVITWNLGMVVKLNRFKFWPRNQAAMDDMWKRGHPKVFELYGSLSPNPNGALDDSWTLLGKFESLMPSGGETPTKEDYDFGLAGIEYDFIETDDVPDPYTSVRYLRWRTIWTYQNAGISPVSINEISFWGQIQK